MNTLRTFGLASLLIGAVATMILMLRAGGPNRPLILVPLFAVWDISPFVVLWLGDRFAGRWPPAVRSALFLTMVIVAVGTVAFYIADAISPRQAQAAFPYVVAPPVAWVLIAVVLGATALLSRKS